MSRKPQFSLFFCEDFRVEVGDKPFIIGVLSPIIYIQGGEPDDVDDDFNLVTSFRLPADIEKVELRLTIVIQRPDVEVETRLLKATVERDEGMHPTEPWSAIIPLPMTIENCVPGTRIEADLSTQYGDAWTSILIAPLEEEEIKPAKRRQRLKAKVKPKRKS